MFYKVARAIAVLFLKIFYDVEIIYPKAGLMIGDGAVVCANHSTNLDPVLVAAAIRGKHVRFMAKKELFKSRFSEFLYEKLLGAFPIKRGESDLKAMRTAIKIVKEGGVLGLFPEGTRNLGGGELDVKAGVGFIIAKTGKPVIPISIDGSSKLFSKIKISVGEAINLSAFQGKALSGDDYREISVIIMNEIRKKVSSEVK